MKTNLPLSSKVPFNAEWVLLCALPGGPCGEMRVGFQIDGRVIEQALGLTFEQAKRRVIAQLMRNRRIARKFLRASPLGCTRLLSAAQAISAAMDWPEEHGLALAYRFAIPARLPLLSVRFWSPPLGRAGRKPDASPSNAILLRMQDAWTELTRTRAAVNERSPFLKAVQAAAPFFRLQQEELRHALRRRLKNIQKGKITLARDSVWLCGGLFPRRPRRHQRRAIIGYRSLVAWAGDLVKKRFRHA